MKTFKATALASVTYLVTSFFLLGGPFALLNFIFFMNDRLGAPLWQLAALFGVVAGSSVFFLPMRRHFSPTVRPAMFVASSLILAVLFVGFYVEVLRRSLIAGSDMDVVLQHTFFRSLHNVPGELQFYLHAAALKGCTPYAWSYRRMEFYALSASAAPNVLPYEWVKRCDIRRPTENG